MDARGGGADGDDEARLRRDEVARLRREIEELQAEFRVVSDLGMRLSREMEPSALLPAIVTAARRFTHSEAGSLYVRDGESLVFAVAQNDALDPTGISGPPRGMRLKLDSSSLAGLAASEKRTLHIADAAHHPSHSRSGQAAFDYAVETMLVTPLVDHHGEVRGVLQLMNSRDGASKARPYSERAARLCEVLASHAATAMEIARLHAELHDVFDALVRYSTSAIDARDACTAGHSSRVGAYARLLAEELGGFTPAELRELRFAGIFHDIGKIGVRECVLTKSTKLDETELRVVEARFAGAAEACHARPGALGEGWPAEPHEAAAALEAEIAFVRKTTTPGWLDEEALARLARLAATRFVTHRGAKEPLLSADQHEKLAVRQGNLTPEERRQMEEHVTFSYKFLRQIPFPADLARVPEIAYSHHERLDGSGYPRGLAGDQILPQAKILAVVDVFDALTASDRPYKRATPAPKAVEIIEKECELGAWDPGAVAALRRLVETGRIAPRQRAGVHGAPEEAGAASEQDVWRT